MSINSANFKIERAMDSTFIRTDLFVWHAGHAITYRPLGLGLESTQCKSTITV